MAAQSRLGSTAGAYRRSDEIALGVARRGRAARASRSRPFVLKVDLAARRRRRREAARRAAGRSRRRCSSSASRSIRRSSPIASCRKRAPRRRRSSSPRAKIRASKKTDAGAAAAERARTRTSRTSSRRAIRSRRTRARRAPKKGTRAGIDGGTETDPNKVQRRRHVRRAARPVLPRALARSRPSSRVGEAKQALRRLRDQRRSATWSIWHVQHGPGESERQRSLRRLGADDAPEAPRRQDAASRAAQGGRRAVPRPHRAARRSLGDLHGDSSRCR